jgi:hypothetical protein
MDARPNLDAGDAGEGDGVTFLVEALEPTLAAFGLVNIVDDPALAL